MQFDGSWALVITLVTTGQNRTRNHTVDNGRIRRKLNTGPRPIVNRYHEEMALLFYDASPPIKACSTFKNKDYENSNCSSFDVVEHPTTNHKS